MHEFLVANWLVSPDRNTITRQGVERKLTPRVMDLLVYLSERPGEVVAADQILSDVWPEPFVGDNALLTAVSSLRKALDDDPRRPAFIETIPKRGYRFVASTEARSPALAVLPLEGLSPDPGEDYFADGITEALIAELGRLDAFRVISRQSVMAYRGSQKPLPEIAGELKVSLIVEGSVLRTDSGVRITAQLIDAAEDRHLWVETHECELSEALGLQRDIATRIASSLSGRQENGNVRKEPIRSTNPDALLAYWRGRFHWWKFSPEHFSRALEYFEEAARLDPSFAPAHAGIADVWGAISYWGAVAHAEVRSKIEQAAKLAVRTDPTSAEAQLMMGAYYFHSERDWQRAETTLRRAIELNPSLAHAHVLHSLFLFAMNRSDEANQEVDLAMMLDPLNPVPLLIRAMWLGSQERYDAARRELDHLLGLVPENAPAKEFLADMQWLEGSEEALATERSLWSNDPEVSSALSDSSASRSRMEALRSAAEILAARAEVTYVKPTAVARLLTHAGEQDEALAWLERAVAADDLLQFDLLRLCPTWNRLRGLARFDELCIELGLPMESEE